MLKNKIQVLIFFCLLGLADALYLTYLHYSHTLPLCSSGLWVDCGKVLNSKYAVIFGIPLALIGVFYYTLLLINLLSLILTENKLFKYFTVLQVISGACASFYFMYLQLLVIRSICLYCSLSAVISFLIFFLALGFFHREKKIMILAMVAFLYQNILRKIFFLFDPEFIHEQLTDRGELLGKITPLKFLIKGLLTDPDPLLKQKINRLSFDSPVGLAAGFDYRAQLQQISPALGFGFQTIGTVTNLAYAGNPRPRLGRLPESRSLMVNKGFKNPGAGIIIDRLNQSAGGGFAIPIGISIGRSNSKKPLTQKESVRDIVQTFIKFEDSKLRIAYYELNISCPNLYGDISFYPPKKLSELLSAVDRLQIRKPIFIKMPIEKNNKETLNLIEIITKYKIAGVIIGNLQKNKKDPAFVPAEVNRWKVGNFSGKPTFNRSNELIRLAYKKFGKKLTIIGCGGIFTASDAYKKIRLGASLLQLITGMIFQGPQVIAQINLGLVDKLKKDGFRNIGEAVGIDVND